MFDIGEKVRIIDYRSAITKYAQIMGVWPNLKIFPRFFAKAEYCGLVAVVKGYKHTRTETEISYILSITVTYPNAEITSRYVYPDWMVKPIRIDWETERRLCIEEIRKTEHVHRTMKEMEQEFGVSENFRASIDLQAMQMLKDMAIMAKIPPEFMYGRETAETLRNFPQPYLTFNKLGIDKVLFDKGTTVIFWKDGSKTSVRASGNDEVNPVTGFLHAFFKHETEDYSNKRRSEFFQKLTDNAARQKAKKEKEAKRKAKEEKAKKLKAKKEKEAKQKAAEEKEAKPKAKKNKTGEKKCLKKK